MEACAGVCLDETGLTIARARHDARAPQGQRVPTSTPLNNGKNITVLGALSLKGITAAMTVEGSPDAQVVFTDVQTLLVPT
jgi:DDE superfamily endonuclease